MTARPPWRDQGTVIARGTGRAGYIALDRFLAQARRVDVLAIRQQREAGFG